MTAEVIVGEDEDEYVCPRCDRGQCARCRDTECACCAGNQDEEKWVP